MPVTTALSATDSPSGTSIASGIDLDLRARSQVLCAAPGAGRRDGRDPPRHIHRRHQDAQPFGVGRENGRLDATDLNGEPLHVEPAAADDDLVAGSSRGGLEAVDRRTLGPAVGDQSHNRLQRLARVARRVEQRHGDDVVAELVLRPEGRKGDGALALRRSGGGHHGLVAVGLTHAHPRRNQLVVARCCHDDERPHDEVIAAGPRDALIDCADLAQPRRGAAALARHLEGCTDVFATLAVGLNERQGELARPGGHRTQVEVEAPGPALPLDARERGG